MLNINQCVTAAINEHIWLCVFQCNKLENDPPFENWVCSWLIPKLCHFYLTGLSLCCLSKCTRCRWKIWNICVHQGTHCLWHIVLIAPCSLSCVLPNSNMWLKSRVPPTPQPDWSPTRSDRRLSLCSLVPFSHSILNWEWKWWRKYSAKVKIWKTGQFNKM